MATKWMSILFFCFVLLFPAEINAQNVCGNGSCQPSRGENCSTCSKDCGSCAPPTATPRPPTPVPPTAVQPSSTPQPPTSVPPTSIPPTAVPPTIPQQPTAGANNPTSGVIQPTTGTNNPISGITQPTPVDGSNPAPSPSNSGSVQNPGSSSNADAIPPTVNVNPVQSPTNNRVIAGSGTATAPEGSVTSVEFSITNGASWQPASLNGSSFTFTTSELPEGTSSILFRASASNGTTTSEGSYASLSVTVNSIPPEVTINAFPENPTKNQSPAVSGTISTPGQITSVELSANGGQTWIKIPTGSEFSYTFDKLEDGNYDIFVRAFDTAGNLGQSQIQTLVVDTIPPVIGGSMAALGIQPVRPSASGVITTVIGTPLTLSVSMRGGVTSAVLQCDSYTFPFKNEPAKKVWQASVSFPESIQSTCTVVAEDGANNTTERTLLTIAAKKSGTISEAEAKPSQDAHVSVYVLQNDTNTWVLWDAAAFNQQNPIKTGEGGNYSFMLPSGRYYLQITKPGFKKTLSPIFEVTTTSIIDYNAQIEKQDNILARIPLVGSYIAQYLPPVTLSQRVFLSTTDADAITHPLQSQPAPPFTLPDTENTSVSLSDFSGKKILISFFSPWSNPSIEQLPLLESGQEKINDSSIIIAVASQENPTATKILVRRGSYSFLTLSDINGIVARTYGISVLPQHYFIDTQGNVGEVYSGVITSDMIVEKLNKLP